jgi:hypothetical protein
MHQSDCIGPPNSFGGSVPINDCNRTCYDLFFVGTHLNSGGRIRAHFHREDTGQVRDQQIETNRSRFFRRERSSSAMFLEHEGLAHLEPREYQAQNRADDVSP